MSTSDDYTVISQVPDAQWVPGLQETVQGWTIRVLDHVTGTYVPVFVPQSNYGTDQARQYIEAALTPVRQIAQLGKTTASK